MRKLQLLGLILLTVAMLAAPSRASAQVSVGISVHIGPPALPIYPQPICPGPGYIWTPGYWAYGPDGYYWVPGTWVIAPAVGLLWTPGYWGWGGGVYLWHAGYWGPHVGFYGGINYGFGYVGTGYVGGYWNHGVFAYNTAVTNVNTTVIHNTYINKTVVNNVTVNNVSYNGGTGGVTAQPTAAERAAEQEHHIAPTTEQTQHEHTASTNRALLASENHGKPSIAATSRPGEFTGHGVRAATAAAHSASPNNPNRPPNANSKHSANNAADLHKNDRPASNGGNSGSSSLHPTNTASHPNNTTKNQPHADNKPHTESKPQHEGGKPHN